MQLKGIVRNSIEKHFNQTAQPFPKQIKKQINNQYKYKQTKTNKQANKEVRKRQV